MMVNLNGKAHFFRFKMLLGVRRISIRNPNSICLVILDNFVVIVATRVYCHRSFKICHAVIINPTKMDIDHYTIIMVIICEKL